MSACVPLRCDSLVCEAGLRERITHTFGLRVTVEETRTTALPGAIEWPVVPLRVGMSSSMPRRPAVQSVPDRMAAVGVDRKLVVPATSKSPHDGSDTGAGVRISEVEWFRLRRLPGVLRVLVPCDRLSDPSLAFHSSHSRRTVGDRWPGLDDVLGAFVRTHAVPIHRSCFRRRGNTIDAVVPGGWRERATLGRAGKRGTPAVNAAAGWSR